MKVVTVFYHLATQFFKTQSELSLIETKMNLNDLSERQARTILERIHQTEKNLVNLVGAISSITRKKAR